MSNIAQHRCVIAMDEIRQVWTDGAASSIDRMALAAHRLFAEKFAVTAGPTAAFEFGRAGGNKGVVPLAIRERPRQQQPTERKRPRPIVLIRRPFDRERRRAACFREMNLD